MQPPEVARILEKLENEGLAPPLDELNLWELEQEIDNCRLYPEQGKTWEETKQELNALRIQR